MVGDRPLGAIAPVPYSRGQYFIQPMPLIKVQTSISTPEAAQVEAMLKGLSIAVANCIKT